MQRSWKWIARALGVAAAVLAVGGCGGGETDPSVPPATIAKSPTKSGDQQSGPVSQALPLELVVVITREDQPARDVTVEWATANGTISPASDKSDADGESTSLWTLGGSPGPQTATASVTGGTGSPVTFTATGTGGGGGGGTTTIQVGAPGNQFNPASVTVLVGTTVTWDWASTGVIHNVVPDGATPPTSGPLTAGPNTYAFTFNTPGMYRYFCQAHGASGGVGMSGTVIVETAQP